MSTYAFNPGVLQVARHVGELGQRLQSREQGRHRLRERGVVRALDRVLELRPADPVLDGQVLNGLEVHGDA